MPVWTVQTAGCEDEAVEASLLTTDSGALLALSPEGLVVRAWAPGQWEAVRCVDDAGVTAEAEEPILYGLPGH